MKFQTDIVYVLRGSMISYVQSFNHRGRIHRFVYSNGSCFDIGPDEISQVKRWFPASETGRAPRTNGCIRTSKESAISFGHLRHYRQHFIFME